MNDPAEMTRAGYELLAEFRHQLRHFLHFSEEAAAAAGLTPRQHQAMLAIKGFPGRDQVTIGELAGRLQIKPHSAVGLANRLVADRHARRVADPRDHRQVWLRLTARGEAVLKTLSAAHQAELRQIEPHLSRLLAALRAAPRPAAPPANPPP